MTFDLPVQLLGFRSIGIADRDMGRGGRFESWNALARVKRSSLTEYNGAWMPDKSTATQANGHEFIPVAMTVADYSALPDAPRDKVSDNIGPVASLFDRVG